MLDTWLPLVTIVAVWPGVGSRRPAPVPHDTQTSLDVIEEIGHRIQLIASRRKGSEDCEVNKNNRNEHGDHVDGVTEEGLSGAVTECKAS